MKDLFRKDFEACSRRWMAKFRMHHGPRKILGGAAVRGKDTP
jgi:hypothetical protein